MKYTRLTKEQFEELHEEFARFLATQSISADEWNLIKETKPEVAEQELDVFSDLVWEGVLNKAEYLENIAPQHIYLFKLNKDDMDGIVIKILDPAKDVSTVEGYTWLQENYAGDSVEFFTASKDYNEDRNDEIFNLIRQGAVITKGELYTFFNKILDR